PDPRGGAVDLFADLLALAGSTDVLVCPTDSRRRSLFAELAMDLHQDRDLRRELLLEG
ncbi:MAG: hypothetical protein RLZZ272_201, partial [Actinomycetota bacterium]